MSNEHVIASHRRTRAPDAPPRPLPPDVRALATGLSVIGLPDAGPLSRLHPLQSCWDAQLAGQDADALNLALELKVFAHLDQFASAAQVAALLALAPGPAGLFLEFLAGMGVLECRDAGTPLYRTAPVVRPYLHPASDLYAGDALLFRHRVLRGSREQLERLLHSGADDAHEPATDALQQGWARAAEQQIAQEQRAVTVPVALEIVRRLPERHQWRQMLDLGGGPGLVAIALAQQLPVLGGVVFDYPAVAEVAQRNIEAAGLQQRLRGVGGDLAHDAIGSGHDLIWCSSVLHFVPDLQPVLQRLHAALAPTGVLVCCHAELGAGLLASRRVQQYYLRMRMQGRHVLPNGQLATLLHAAGFAQVEQIDDVRFPVAPVTALIARKQAAAP